MTESCDVFATPEASSPPGHFIYLILFAVLVEIGARALGMQGERSAKSYTQNQAVNCIGLV